MTLRYLFQMSQVIAAASSYPVQPQPQPMLPTANTQLATGPLKTALPAPFDTPSAQQQLQSHRLAQRQIADRPRPVST